MKLTAGLSSLLVLATAVVAQQTLYGQVSACVAFLPDAHACSKCGGIGWFVFDMKVLSATDRMNYQDRSHNVSCFNNCLSTAQVGRSCASGSVCTYGNAYYTARSDSHLAVVFRKSHTIPTVPPGNIYIVVDNIVDDNINDHNDHDHHDHDHLHNWFSNRLRQDLWPEVHSQRRDVLRVWQ